MSQVLATAVRASKESDVIKVQCNSICKISLSPSVPLCFVFVNNDVLKNLRNELRDSIYSVL